ncbi:polygalacturonase inhibitor PGIP [Cinnamomum micranthum f. kanehirae]|uniref:Polygalacturonase inhibitor PGIP n=1 Tax=Cinnamomum micranthum f. kanehirae TaxID=337451 RepID=A0A443NGY8_9MAGN|nr:polygalacturonase inhibitor PGIP [Cinnamomum micranthum f. kanehirae]
MPSSSIHLFFFFLLFFSSFIFTFSLAADRCNPNDKKVLLQIKESFNNPYLLASWNPKTDCCGWYQLECDEITNRVTALTIFGGEISGQIPPYVGDLPYLKTLIFRKLSNLTGHIQPAIAKLKNLTMIRLSWTNLSGSVPDFLATLPNLDYLDLSFNDLTGSIPPSLAKLTKLNALHLDRNRLTGSIPEAYGQFKGSVPDLYLSHNRLTGRIPKSLGDLDLDLDLIELQRNMLVGDASFLFRNSSRSTFRIDISRNFLEFDLSGAIFPENLGALDISHNRIYGNIPSQITALGNLQGFNASYNRLCGKIPQGGRMGRFDYSSFFHNRCLCGTPLPNNCTSG